jgi:hypothetical protein
MQRVLRAAGLGGEPGLKPASIPAVFGLRLWLRTRDLQLVADALGITGLDTAAGQIGLADQPRRPDAAEQMRGAVLGGAPARAAAAGRAAPGVEAHARARQGEPVVIKTRSVRTTRGAR